MVLNKRTFGVLSILVLISMVLAACSGQANNQSVSSSNSFTGYGAVTQVSFTDTVESTGQVQPQHMANLTWTTTGTVASSSVTVGQTVKTGDKLMSLDSTTVPANLQTAQTDLTNAITALNQLTNPDLSTISNAQKALSDAYTNYLQALSALSNAIITNQNANTIDQYNNWFNSKSELVNAQNNLPLANASIDVQEYFQLVRDTSVLQSELTAAQQIAAALPGDTSIAQKVTDLQAAVQNSQAKETALQAAVPSDKVTLVTDLSDKLTSYESSTYDFIGNVTTDTTNSNVNLAQLQADLTQKQSSLITAQSNLTDLQNKRLSMNGKRCSDATIADYQAAYDRALAIYNMSAHVVGSPEERALQTASANLTWCTSFFSQSDLSSADANIASTQAQIQLLQAQIAQDQSQISDAGSSVYGLAISLNTVWSAYQVATQQLSSAITTLYQLQRLPDPNDLAAAQARVQSAQAQVNSLSLIAPISGEVTNVGFLQGDSVDTKTTAVVIVDRSHLNVDLQIDESHVVKLALGDQATIAIEAMPSLSLTGTVAYINPVGTSSSGVVYYDVQVNIDNPDPSILIGATADVTIQAGEPKDVLTVPVSAVGSTSQNEYVYVIGSGGNSQQVAVVSGQILANDMVIVTGDLKAGDTVGLLATPNTTTNNTGSGGGRFFGP